MRWRLSHRADPVACAIADRHYSRQKIGTRQFTPPGRCLVLLAGTGDKCALWVTSWPFAAYVKHAWPGAWVCSLFRNEGAGLSSELIVEAVAATRAYYGDPPDHGMVTFVNTRFTKSPNPGYCYQMAGFGRVGTTKAKLPALQLRPGRMPTPQVPWGFRGPHRDAVGVDAFRIFG